MEIVLADGMFFKYDWFPVPLGYDARKTSWFKSAVAAEGEVVWMDPGKSGASNILLLTCAKAVMINGKADAVLMINILPTTISNEFVITRSTDCFAFIATPESLVAREDIASKKLVWTLSEKEKSEYYKAVISKFDFGRKGVFTTVLNGERLDVAYCPMTPGKFIIGVAAQRRKINEKAGNMLRRVEKEKNLYISSSSEYINGKILLYLGIGFAVSLLMLFFAAWAAVRIGRPISRLEEGVKLLGQRKFNERIMVKSNDEFQELAETFNSMAVELGRQIKSLRDNIAHQERARHELAVASEIQKSMLPDASLTFPEHDEFDIYAEMHPAREVGGDFYDFFFVDKKHLFFTVGDISGKGFSAALFMMRTLTLLRHEAEERLPPDEIFINVSNELCHNNDSCMFFTGICGLLNIGDGEVVLCNAGHPLPYLRQGRNFEPVPMESGIVVGPMPLKDKCFVVKRFTLAKGDTLFLYTDGITEAFNPQKLEFQSERLHAALRKLSGGNPHEIITGISRAVAEFIQGAPQSDDISMLSIKYYG
ncbi:MAG: SpoIIE family protein phosphatase [Victivallales bacterium]|nr:SpoIIE family protein phosphatase [Victivallales bacterium]